MIRIMTTLATAAPLSMASFAVAQDQQAGNDASANADATFQKLIEQCDNTDALVLRARIRLQLERTTPEAKALAQEGLNKGLALCGQGDQEGAIATLNAALETASSGTTEVFGTDASVEAPAAVANQSNEASKPDAEDIEADEKPWWKFW